MRAGCNVAMCSSALPPPLTPIALHSLTPSWSSIASKSSAAWRCVYSFDALVDLPWPRRSGRISSNSDFQRSAKPIQSLPAPPKPWSSKSGSPCPCRSQYISMSWMEKVCERAPGVAMARDYAGKGQGAPVLAAAGQVGYNSSYSKVSLLRAVVTARLAALARRPGNRDRHLRRRRRREYRRVRRRLAARSGCTHAGRARVLPAPRRPRRSAGPIRRAVSRAGGALAPRFSRRRAWRGLLAAHPHLLCGRRQAAPRFATAGVGAAQRAAALGPRPAAGVASGRVDQPGTAGLAAIDTC